jgi:pilus assembly protein Flp/PilA
MTKTLTRFWRDETATTAIEYAIIAGGIALAIITAVKGLGISANSNFEAVRAALN